MTTTATVAPATLATLINGMECDHVFRITETGLMDVDNVWAPEVAHSDTEDIYIYDAPGDGWQALTGYTGQYGYRGAVMHASEYIGGRLARDMVERALEAERDGAPLVWTWTEVKDGDDAAGWCVLYRPLPVPATVSGVVDCACCGQHVMTSNVAAPAYCDGCNESGDCDASVAWHCETGECDGTACDDHSGPAYDPTNVGHPSGIPLAYSPSTHTRSRCEDVLTNGSGTRTLRCVGESGHADDHYSPYGGGVAWPVTR